MSTAKEETRKMLDTLPDDATWEDIQYSIFVRERVERGRREAAEGKLTDQDEVEERMKRWLQE
jgi:predicted transcriptional regulator